MMDIQSILIAVLVIEGAAIAVCDRGMRSNRADGVTEDQLRWTPLYWDRADLFDDRGNQFRRGAILAFFMAFATLLGIALTSDGLG